MKEPIADSHKFRLWKNTLEANGLTVHGVEEVYTVNRRNGEALFSLLLLNAQTPEGQKIPPVCFLKGEVVSILICLIDRQSREKYLLLVAQRRICNGDILYETVAGMVDNHDAPLETALREAAEESGLLLHADEVHALNDAPLYVSTGTSDEAMYFFYVEREMDHDEIMRYHGQATGTDHEHEYITTHIATLPEAMRLIKNVNGLLNIYLYLQQRPYTDKVIQ